MGIFTKDIKTMDDLFLHQLEDIYYAEQSSRRPFRKWRNWRPTLI